MTLKLNGSSSGSVALDAPTSTTSGADITFKLPVADGTAGQVLQTDGSGNLSWVSLKQWVHGTATTAGTGDTYTFTGIPSTAKRIVVTFENLSPATAAAELLAKVGNSSGILSSGYVSTGGHWYGSGSAVTNYTNAHRFGQGNYTDLSNTWDGIWTLYNVKDNIWVSQSHASPSSGSTSFQIGDSKIDTSSALTQIQLGWNDGSAVFDGGFVTVDYLVG